MIYYTIFFILVYYFSRTQVNIGKRDVKGSRALLVGFCMLLLMGLRDKTVAGDTIMYVYDFLYKPVEWTGIKEFFTENKEPMFYFVEYLCQKVTSSYTVYLFVTSVMVVIGFSKLLKQYSEDMFLSVLLFCGVGSMYFCMAGLRQAIAMGCTMLAFKYAKERKLIKFLLWCLVAYGFHNSAIVFVFVYLLVNSKPNWKMWIAVAVSVFLGYTKNPIVIEVAKYFTSKEYQMDEQGLNYTLFFIQLVFVIFCFVFRKQALQHEKQKQTETFDSLLMMSFIGLCFQAFTPVKGEFFRVSSYFSVYLCMAVPKALNSLGNKDKKIVYAVMSVGLLAYIYIFGNARSYMTFF